MGDFNARHPDLGDVSPIPNRSGVPLLNYIHRYHLNRWDIDLTIKSHIVAHAWTLDQRIMQAERVAADAGLAFQTQPTPNHLLQYQQARDDLVALQKCVYTEVMSNLCNLRLMAALLESDKEDKELITEDELRRAVMGKKNSAPGDDGLTYQVLRLLQKVPGNPLLQLYNLCYQHGYVPAGWTISTIIPIPKPGTDKYRPISLTSCFSKVFERILLTRLMYQLQEKTFSPFVWLSSSEYSITV
ncbi:uncharacterized protein LOC135224825 [Macrobrachium nipponense]|uniref:uncharacterized protein LOC135224825 n=1 Tax=Macrobrachium nipponense TaxID=159736 RepID=UPI0030C820A6